MVGAMKREAKITERVLHFKQPAGTSRGVYTERRIWLVELSDGERVGVGECAPLPDLSCDAGLGYAATLRRFCDEWERCDGNDDAMERLFEQMRDYPSMLFGLETAMLSLQSSHLSLLTSHLSPLTSHLSPFTSHFSPLTSHLLFDTPFSRGEEGIPINGLVWIGSHDEMLERLEQKLDQGFRCVKLKVGAIDFEQELDLVKRIRKRFSHHVVELRLDANGGFSNNDSQQDGGHGTEAALYKLELLSQYAIHSIEQPIRQGQWAYMAELCRDSPLPIALDEELIGVNDAEMKSHLLSVIKPAYIVLKPSLHGGMRGCREWIGAARQHGIGSWMTSALESNIGLNAIAQFCSDVYGNGITMPQGLGTGQLFTDNIPMPLEVRGDQLWRMRN